MRHRPPVLLTALLLTGLAGPAAAPATAEAAPAAAQAAPVRAKEEPLPVPFIEREEVRFITLDIVAEENAGGWRPLRDLTVRQIEIRVGDRVMPVDLFENRCRSEPAMGAQPGHDATAGSSPPTPAGAAADRTTTNRTATDRASPGADAGHRFILYFDMEHLERAGRHAAFKAALAWAGRDFGARDKVMIITGGRGLRIVRTFLPAGDHLRQDLEAARDDFRASELWGAFESVRLNELEQEKNFTVRRMQANAYVQIDRSKTRNSLANLRNVMTVFDAVEGTKNLILFADTIRLVPGRQYGDTTTPLIDIHTELQGLAGAANERNVRIYPVKAGLPPIYRGSDPRDSWADSALTMLAHQTGGRTFDSSNAVDGIFERVGEDLACFYRVGFRIRPRYSGRVEPIRVRLLDREGAVRLRYRQTLEDPTLEDIDADLVRAAFMAPAAADDFPIAVRATELFRRDGGARLQVEVATPLGALLGLPLPGGRRGSRQVRVQIGARVVPLRPIEDGAGPTTSRRGVWADVATDRQSFGFGRQAVLTLPPLPTPDRTHDRVVATEEFDAPPGRYRIVAIVQDQLARTISAATTDIEVRANAPRLGRIGLTGGDTRAIIVQEQTKNADGTEGDASDWKGKELAAASPLLPRGVLLSETSVVEAGSAAHLFYSVCVDWSRSGRRPSRRSKRSSRTPQPPSPEWDLERTLTCGPENEAIPLLPLTLPQEKRGLQCVPMIDSIPAARLSPGTCRFEVRLGTPDGDPERAILEFIVVPPTRRDATTTGSLTAPGRSPASPL